MDTMGNGGSTELLDRPGTAGPLGRRFGRDRLRNAAPGAEVIDMRGWSRPTAEATGETEVEATSRQRGNAGLGAFTAIVFTIIAYTTLFGALALVGSIRGFAAGEDAGGGLLTGLVLMAPASAAVVARLRHPAERSVDPGLGERDAARRSA